MSRWRQETGLWTVTILVLGLQVSCGGKRRGTLSAF